MMTPPAPQDATAQAVAARLPQTPLISAMDLAIALGLPDTRTIYRAIEQGRLSAVRPGRSARIARAEAIRWLTLENSTTIG